jgi:hypothetical protein
MPLCRARSINATRRQAAGLGSGRVGDILLLGARIADVAVYMDTSSLTNLDEITQDYTASQALP